MPQLHPRTLVVSEARSEISASLLTVAQRYQLTNGEMLRILAQELDGWARFLVREERHPDNPEKKGDEL